MATIDLGKVRGENGKDGKDGKDGGFIEIELLENPLLEGEVYTLFENNISTDQIKSMHSWDIPIALEKLTKPPQVNDIIEIELESPYDDAYGNRSRFIIQYKCMGAQTMEFNGIPNKITATYFTLSNVLEPHLNINWFQDINSITSSIEFDNFVTLGGIDNFQYIHGLPKLLKYADEYCGGVIEGLGSTADLRMEFGDGNAIRLTIPSSGNDYVEPWWSYSTSSNGSGNLTALVYFKASNNGLEFPSYRVMSMNTGGLYEYTGQYKIKSVKYKGIL